MMLYRKLSSVHSWTAHEICAELHRATQFMQHLEHSMRIYGNLCCAMIFISICGKIRVCWCIILYDVPSPLDFSAGLKGGTAGGTKWPLEMPVWGLPRSSKDDLFLTQRSTSGVIEAWRITVLAHEVLSSLDRQFNMLENSLATSYRTACLYM